MKRKRARNATSTNDVLTFDVKWTKRTRRLEKLSLFAPERIAERERQYAAEAKLARRDKWPDQISPVLPPEKWTWLSIADCPQQTEVLRAEFRRKLQEEPWPVLLRDAQESRHSTDKVLCRYYFSTTGTQEVKSALRSFLKMHHHIERDFKTTEWIHPDDWRVLFDYCRRMLYEDSGRKVIDKQHEQFRVFGCHHTPYPAEIFDLIASFCGDIFSEISD